MLKVGWLVFPTVAPKAESWAEPTALKTGSSSAGSLVAPLVRMLADLWAHPRAGATAGWWGRHLAGLWGARRAAELARNLADL